VSIPAADLAGMLEKAHVAGLYFSTFYLLVYASAF